jgi:ferritin-like metal-binding protein YciE
MQKKTTKSTATSRKSSASSSNRSHSAGAQKSANYTETIDPSHSKLMEFFTDELKDIYYAEKLLVKALTKMSKKATTEELQTAFLDHKAQTEEQISRLEEVFGMIGKKPQGKKCEAMTGIVEEVNSVIEDTEDDTLTRDAALIIGAQKAEHYEIATYGGLIQLARTMGHDDIVEVLQETLNEEKETDQLLTSIAESSINEQANQEEA